MSDLEDYEDDPDALSSAAEREKDLQEIADANEALAAEHQREDKRLRNHAAEEASVGYKLTDVYHYFAKYRGEKRDARNCKSHDSILTWTCH